jgi:hypothetical protein
VVAIGGVLIGVAVTASDRRSKGVGEGSNMDASVEVAERELVMAVEVTDAVPEMFVLHPVMKIVKIKTAASSDLFMASPFFGNIHH